MRLPGLRFRSTNLRVKVAALLALVCALWAFAAWVTTRDGMNLIFVQTLNSKVFQPSEPLLLELQQERRMTLEYLGAPGAQQRAAMDAQRRKVTALEAPFEQSAQSGLANFAGSAQLQQRIRQTVAALDGLDKTRSAVDAQQVDRVSAAGAFTAVLDSIFQVYDALGNLDDKQIAHDTAALIQLNHARELISQEDALLSGVIAAGRITAPEIAQFAELVGAQRFFGTEAAAAVAPTDRARYDAVMKQDAGLHDIEDHVIQTSRPGAKVPADRTEWRAAVDPALTGLHDVVSAGGVSIVQRATPVAIWVLLRVVLAAGLGLLAVVASIVVAMTTLRSLLAQLRRLRVAAHELADVRLPDVVVRLGRGQEVDVAAEAPPLDFGNDEIGQVGQVFNRVQETAIRAAVEQADLRRGVRDVFLSLARRSQALVHRQLQLLDGMERRETESDELDDLFRIDHLATRMRRNAENLIVLSGAVPGRGWRNPVPVVDVIRGALAEVEDYARVTLLPVDSAALAGRAVGDVIHLLAELMENAVSFSPPYTTVQVGGSLVANGIVVEIEDRGLGMSEADLARANEQLAEPPEFNLTSTAQLGLFVVGRLAERHGIRVRLRDSPYGGTTAIVLIPSNLVVDAQDESVRSRRATRFALETNTSASRAVHGAAPGATAQALAAPVDGAEPPAGPAALAASASEGVAPPGWVADPTVSGPAAARHAAPPRQDASASPATPPASASPPLAWPPVPGAAATPAGRPLPAQPTVSSSTMDGVSAPPTVDGVAIEPAVDGIDSEPVTYTSAGLPWRRRQASLAPPLRGEPPIAEPSAGQAEIPGRKPEEIRRMMSSYQTGTMRGRIDAAVSQDTPDAAPPEPPSAQPTDEQQS
jgi:signal transduction histidine kinase